MDKVCAPGLGWVRGGGEEVVGRASGDEVTVSLIDYESNVTFSGELCKRG